MDRLNHQQFVELSKHRADPSLSLFMPTFRSGPDEQQNAVQLRDLVDRARDELQSRNIRRPEIDSFLEPVERLRWRPRASARLSRLSRTCLHL